MAFAFSSSKLKSGMDSIGLQAKLLVQLLHFPRVPSIITNKKPLVLYPKPFTNKFICLLPRETVQFLLQNLQQKYY
jgi:hypothetical protein